MCKGAVSLSSRGGFLETVFSMQRKVYACSFAWGRFRNDSFHSFQKNPLILVKICCITVFIMSQVPLLSVSLKNVFLSKSHF